MPIVGITQDAMVLRMRLNLAAIVPFRLPQPPRPKMLTTALSCITRRLQYKVRGTWNLHEIVESLGPKLDLFTLLSSLSGIIGHVNQANYAAGNVFLDAFATYCQACGQPACSIDLSISEDAGVIAKSAKLKESVDSRM
ncbi:KR domain-containing protein [Hypoxylon crocopeplum]|nr:KR domain-containing protein [Hypoxylon crocopeplum]